MEESKTPTEVQEVNDLQEVKTPTELLPALSFKVDGQEFPVLEVRNNGDFLVNGNLVTTDIEVYHGFKEWLVRSGMIKAETVGVNTPEAE